MSELNPLTFPLQNLLTRHAGQANKVLLVRSGPLEMVEDILAVLNEWNPELAITHYCHRGQELESVRNLVYGHPGYFRLKYAEMNSLRDEKFDLALIPYATDRRLHPEYHEIDRIAVGTGAGAVIAVYWDRTALLLDPATLERKRQEIVIPYLNQKQAAIEEIVRFTGEPVEEIEDKCHLAAARGDRQWRELAPASDDEIESFYRGTDFYIYALMKECDWRGARSDIAGPLAEAIPRGSKVLDYGAGCGAVGIALAGQGMGVTHLDLPGSLLEFARSRYQSRGLDVRLLQADKKYPLDENYDAIICTHVLEHVTNPEEKLRHMAAHLAPEGRMFIAIPFEANPVGGAHPGMHLNRMTAESYANLLDELGMQRRRLAADVDLIERRH